MRRFYLLFLACGKPVYLCAIRYAANINSNVGRLIVYIYTARSIRLALILYDKLPVGSLYYKYIIMQAPLP